MDLKRRKKIQFKVFMFLFNILLVFVCSCVTSHSAPTGVKIVRKKDTNSNKPFNDPPFVNTLSKSDFLKNHERSKKIQADFSSKHRTQYMDETISSHEVRRTDIYNLSKNTVENQLRALDAKPFIYMNMESEYLKIVYVWQLADYHKIIWVGKGNDSSYLKLISRRGLFDPKFPQQRRLRQVNGISDLSKFIEKISSKHDFSIFPHIDNYYICKNKCS